MSLLVWTRVKFSSYYLINNYRLWGKNSSEIVEKSGELGCFLRQIYLEEFSEEGIYKLRQMAS